MSNETNLQTKGTFSLSPRNLEEAIHYAEIMAKSVIIPKAYHGKPADVLVAVQMGSEIGLKPMQSLQNIAVINGKPSVYGDALIALVQANPKFENIKEYFDEQLQAAVCVLKRINESEHTVIYSIEDAKKASLWNKPGPWQQYPKRMLQMRARGFALRDKFADVLGGLITAEEAQDYPIDVTPNPRMVTQVVEDDKVINQEVKYEEKKSKDWENIDEIYAYGINYSALLIDAKTIESLRETYSEVRGKLSPFMKEYLQARKTLEELTELCKRLSKNFEEEVNNQN
jgi:hypothetical protein